MNLMHAARIYGYDTIPMRGVDFDKAMEYLEIDSNLIPILFLSVGKATAPGHDKKRHPVSSFAQIIS